MKILKHALVCAVWALWGVSTQTLAVEPSKDEAGSQKIDYELGQGLRLGNTGFTLGGYASMQYENQKDAAPRGSFSHLSLMLWWDNGSRLKFFSELDSEDTLATRYRPDNDEKRYLSLERFYFDYSASDLLTIRLGKFLTPIGRWNLIHAAPLVWTTSRPLMSRKIFPDNATGLMALGNLSLAGAPADYNLYVSFAGELRKDPAQDPFSEALGGRLNLGVNNHTQIGFSYARFSQQALREERKTLLGTDFIWSSGGYELSGELAYRFSDEGSERAVKGAFIQTVIPLSFCKKLFAVGRVETLKMPGESEATRQALIGLNYRFTPTSAFKLELIHVTHNGIGASDGIMSSVSVLF